MWRRCAFRKLTQVDKRHGFVRAPGVELDPLPSTVEGRMRMHAQSVAQSGRQQPHVARGRFDQPEPAGEIVRNDSQTVGTCRGMPIVPFTDQAGRPGLVHQQDDEQRPVNWHRCE
jgi:hypothetical protein